MPTFSIFAISSSLFSYDKEGGGVATKAQITPPMGEGTLCSRSLRAPSLIRWERRTMLLIRTRASRALIKKLKHYWYRWYVFADFTGGSLRRRFAELTGNVEARIITGKSPRHTKGRRGRLLVPPSVSEGMMRYWANVRFTAAVSVARKCKPWRHGAVTHNNCIYWYGYYSRCKTQAQMTVAFLPRQ